MFEFIKTRIDLETDNPWNVPDWTDSSAYPDPKETEDWAWHWEFLRRRPSYRKLWLEYQDNCTEWRRLDDDGKSREMREAEYVGLFPLISPAVKTQDHFILSNFVNIPSLCEVSRAFNDMSEFCQRAHDECQYLIAITPTERLGEQWKIIQQQIKTLNEEHSAELKEEPKQRLQHGTYPFYLRLLDARGAKPCPSWERITATFNSEVGYKKREKRSIMNSYKTACKLVNTGPILPYDK